MRRIKISKGAYLQISFAWLFAIIVGAVILALAIYGVTKINHTGQQAVAAKTGKEIGVLLDPLETGFETAATTTLSLPVETRIQNGCDNFTGNFGQQEIRLAQQSAGKWVSTDSASAFENKYIYSKSIVQGRNFFVFSKTFHFPYKVSDVIYLTSSEDSYCFMNPPNRIKTELTNLNQSNLYLGNCPLGSTKVCFAAGGAASGDCNITVDDIAGTVVKDGSTLYYTDDSLMYAAIFASPKIYECQTSRLIQRDKQLALLYNGKMGLLISEGCSPDMNLLGFENALATYGGSSDLASLSFTADQINTQNSAAECELW